MAHGPAGHIVVVVVEEPQVVAAPDPFPAGYQPDVRQHTVYRQ